MAQISAHAKLMGRYMVVTKGVQAMKKIINAPSLANCNGLQMGEDIAQLVEGGVNFLHFDIMDGHYVPNICLPLNYIRDIKNKYPDITMEVHMMVDNPAAYISRLAETGADYVSFHADATRFCRRTITEIRAAGMKAGVVVNPSQRIDILEPYAGLIDYVILMTVEPGFAGQLFLPNSVERIRELNKLRQSSKANFLIEIDGGVDYQNTEDCILAGADILVTGVYITFRQKEGIVSACKRFDEYMSRVVSKMSSV